MKKCRDECPNCGEENEIDWGDIEIVLNSAFQKCFCNKCDTRFIEVYEYVGTEIV